MTEYYKALGVSKTSSAAEISEAFRRLALKREDLASLDRLAEAYQVLSDPGLRHNYDLLGDFVFRHGLVQADRRLAGHRGQNSTADVLSTFFGSEHPFFTENPDLKQVKNTTAVEDIVVKVPCTLEELFVGCRKDVRFKNQKGEDGVRQIEIQPGCEGGQKIVFRGEGKGGEMHPTGDLVFEVEEVRHERFRRDGKNLTYTAKVGLLHALAGWPIEIVTCI
jgi:curved DNA-binding protein